MSNLEDRKLDKQLGASQDFHARNLDPLQDQSLIPDRTEHDSKLTTELPPRHGTDSSLHNNSAHSSSANIESRLGRSNSNGIEEVTQKVLQQRMAEGQIFYHEAKNEKGNLNLKTDGSSEMEGFVNLTNIH